MKHRNQSNEHVANQEHEGVPICLWLEPQKQECKGMEERDVALLHPGRELVHREATGRKDPGRNDEEAHAHHNHQPMLPRLPSNDGGVRVHSGQPVRVIAELERLDAAVHGVDHEHERQTAADEDKPVHAPPELTAVVRNDNEPVDDGGAREEVDDPGDPPDVVLHGAQRREALHVHDIELCRDGHEVQIVLEGLAPLHGQCANDTKLLNCDDKNAQHHGR
mmetsp:Transcript_123740/g.385349  ORF Transcript_123740/g.385349 Transcript_123740/m.385349 type:complete len:221 (-) Transcript_123740:22-684(-)